MDGKTEVQNTQSNAFPHSLGGKRKFASGGKQSFTAVRTEVSYSDNADL